MVLGASNLTYADATWTQSSAGLDWRNMHDARIMAPRLLIPDNLKSGVNKSSFYDLEINSSPWKHAHDVDKEIPARPRKPKDKSQSGG